MTIEYWLFWLILSAVLLIIELTTGTVAFLCLSIGCVGALILALLHLSIVWQIVGFVIVSALAFIYFKPMAKKLLHPRNTTEYRTNMDALIGRTGKVTKEVTNNFDDKGRVQIDGDSWLAYTRSADVPIHRGEQVVVESYDSLVICVRRASEKDR